MRQTAPAPCLPDVDGAASSGHSRSPTKRRCLCQRKLPSPIVSATAATMSPRMSTQLVATALGSNQKLARGLFRSVVAPHPGWHRPAFGTRWLFPSLLSSMGVGAGRSNEDVGTRPAVSCSSALHRFDVVYWRWLEPSHRGGSDWARPRATLAGSTRSGRLLCAAADAAYELD